MTSALIEVFLSDLLQKGIKVWVDDGALRVRAAKGALTPDLKASLAARKEEILAFAAKSDPSDGPNDIPVVPRDGRPLPLSFAQQRLWFIDQMASEDQAAAAYNMPIALKLEGPLNEDALRAAIDGVIARHENLRTCFPSKDGMPFQAIQPPAPAAFHIIDLRENNDPEEAARVNIREETNRRFVLETGPMIRLFLYRLADSVSVLLANMHHIIADAWSIEVFSQEVVAQYLAQAGEEAPPLPPLTIQYADYAVWQREHFTDKVLASEIEWWRKELRGDLPVLQLPSPLAAEDINHGGGEEIFLNENLSDQLRQLARNRETTLFTVMLSAYAMLLSRFTGQSELCVGTPATNRENPSLEPLIGFFINTLTLRCQLSDNPSFTDLLARLKDVVLGATSHQTVPFEKLVETLQPDRTGSPFFQTVFNFQETPGSSGESIRTRDGLQVSSFTTLFDNAKYDLTFTVVNTNRLAVTFEYKAGLLGSELTQNMASCFAALLEQIVENPDQRVVDYRLLETESRQTILSQWNQTDATLPNPVSVAALFSAQAEIHPDALAIDGGDETLTYRQLDEKSNQIAHHLRANGVTRGSLVGVLVNRSPRAIVGLLAILKSGGTYLPLDPSTPTPRLSFIFEDAGLSVLLAEDDLVDHLPSFAMSFIHLLTFEEIEDVVANASTHVVPRLADGQDLAYLMYTSGSTGEPKGVAIPRAAVVRLAINSMFDGIDEAATVLHGAPLSFDAATFELWVPLSRGAKVSILPSGVPTAAVLASMIRERGVDTMFLTTALFNTVIDEDPSSFEGLQRLYFGGEAVSVRHVSALGSVVPELCHVYGPTEVTTFATRQRVLSPPKGQTVPIGHAIGNTRAYVVDRQGEIVPLGVTGELWLAGLGLAQGYFNRPSLTATVFCPDGLSGRKGERVYRTGDLVRLLRDGSIEFKGRADGQVKVRGFRIELGEIENALLSHHAIQKAFVTVRQLGADKRLAAYLIASDHEGPPTQASLRDYLNDHIPSYMVPTEYVFMHAFPLNVNGKVDKKALPDPGEFTDVQDATFTAPRDPVEGMLAGIWEDLLAIQRPLSVHENFFDLGGHSLLATQLLARMKEAFKLELPLSLVFETPTVAGIARGIDIAIKANKGVALDPIEASPEEGDAPLSFSQRRLWFIDRLDPGSPAYNIPVMDRLKGDLDPTILRAAISEILRRHEALRTVFTTLNGSPIQRILPFEPLSESQAPVHDLTDLPVDQRWSTIQHAYVQETHRRFNLETGPLFHFSLYKLDDGDHALLVNMHHIITDGWSMGILLRELNALYSAFSLSQPSPLEPLPLQYRDIAHWQHRQVEKGAFSTQMDYWRGKLSSEQPLLEMPFKKPYPSVPNPLGSEHHLFLGASLSEKLRDTAKRHTVTPFMVFLAVYKMALQRYTGQTDLCAGTSVAGRSQPGTESLIGFFVNALALRTDLSGDPSFIELLGRIQETAVDAFSNQELPFEKIVEELLPKRDPNRTPFFQAFFTYQETDGGLRTTGDHHVVEGLRQDTLENAEQLEENTYRQVKFDLALTVVNAEPAFGLSWEYRDELFDQAFIAQFAEHFNRLMHAALENPERRLSQLPMLTQEETKVLAETWNQEPAEPGPGDLLDAFAAHVATRPDAVAVRCNGQSWRYDELDRAANQLAQHLSAMGVGIETPVGVCLNRDHEAVITLLATFKAGGVYLPLDPEYPLERLSFMLDDADLAVIVTRDSLLDNLPSYQLNFLPTILLDDDADLIEAYPSELPPRIMPRERLAYLIYTSGSTGKPKGAGTTHKGLINLARQQTTMFRVTEESTVLQFSSLSFDASVSEIAMAMNAGASLLMASRETLMPGPALARFMTEEGVTHLTMPPSALANMPDELPSLETLVVAGEACTPALVTRYAPNCRMINAYGPTEASVCAAMSLCEPDGTPPPIGLPMGNVTNYVLDHAMNLVPGSVRGELFIGGKGVGRGYWKRPAKTASEFVPDPFSKIPGARLYRSGDLVHRRDDGALVFVGRGDFQVKLRGYRIELGEIERIADQHDQVNAAAVIMLRHGTDDTRLVAYLATDQPDQLDTQAVIEHFNEHLPSYMVPGTIVPMTRLPLTVNGKVDRRALPTPESMLAERTVAEARTAEESTMLDLWRDILKIPRLGIHDNFFEFGGHSLLATQLLARLEERYGTEVSLQLLFEFPNVASFTNRFHATLANRNKTNKPPLQSISRNQSLPLSFAQQRLWFIDQIDPGSSAYNIPIAEQLQGHVNVPALTEAIAEIIKRHEGLRSAFPATEGVPHLAILPPPVQSLDHVDLSGLPAELAGEHLKHLAAKHAMQTFDLAKGPLFANALISLSDAEHVLLVTMHHAISDGWSMQILRREVAVLYATYDQGLPSPLPLLSIQVADVAHWQRQWLNDQELENQLSYWRNQLAGSPSVLNLPTVGRATDQLSDRGETVSLKLNDSVANQLRTVAANEGATRFMLLLAVTQLLLARYGGQDDVSVGVPVAGRREKATQDLIGFFVNTLVLRGQIRGNPSFIDWLNHVRETVLNGYDHQDIPFERLVEALAPDRDLQHSPLFRVMFDVMELDEASTEPSENVPAIFGGAYAFDYNRVKFDLSITFTIQADTVHLSMEYRADLFERDTVRAMAERLERLLADAVSNPSTPVHCLSLIEPASEHAFLDDLNRTAKYSPMDTSLPVLFEDWVDRQPQALAIQEGDVIYDYAALDRQGNQLAHHLKTLGVTDEMPVAICLPRSANSVIAQLAILKAGGAYVPIDPSSPPGRLKTLCDRAGISLVITSQDFKATIEATGVTTTCLDEVPSNTATDRLPRYQGGNRLAYVIHTSGSTGEPKGVAVPHRAAVRLHLGTDHLTVNPGDVVAHLGNPVFDITVAEIWGALLCGGSLDVTPEAFMLDPAAMAAYLRERRVRVLHVTASVFNHLTAHDPGMFAAIDAITVGGEKVSVPPIVKVLETAPPKRLIQCYGPTENGVFSSYYPIQELSADQDAIPLGYPLANSSLYLLDRALEPVPTEIVGEIAVGGAGLARGYLNRPALTALSFVPNPFANEPGDRLYRTGDLARWQGERQLIFEGRRDAQIKIRGVRIETGEIEAVLMQHALVSEAHVLQIASDQLAAFVATSAAEPDLFTWLQQHLPAYMIPNRIVTLATMPLTPNGKLDRAELITKAAGQMVQTKDIVAPRNAQEQAIADLWCSVLERESVGVHENFFEAGGHSLLATRVVAKLAAECGVALNVRDLFEAPTIATLAQRAQNAQKPGDLIKPISRDRDLPLSFAQKRFWFIDQMDPGSPIYNVPLVRRSQSQLHVPTLESTLNQLVARHEVLRTRFQQSGGQPFQHIERHQPIKLSMIDLSGLSETERQEEARYLTEREAARRFNLQTGPLFHFHLVRLGDNDDLLVLNLHHIITDGWSMQQLVAETISVYTHQLQNKVTPLPPLPFQYADYAAWQDAQFNSGALNAQLAYWQNQLAETDEPLDLPTDYPYPKVAQADGSHVRLQLSESMSHRLRQLAEDQQASLFMVLMAAFQTLLHRYGGQQDIRVGTPVSGRHLAGTEMLQGCFLNMLAIRGHFQRGLHFNDLLEAIKQTTLDAFANQDAPFEKLVEVLQPEHSLTRSPIFQVSFTHQDTITADSERSVSFQSEEQGFEFAFDAAKYDMSLITVNQPELAIVIQYRTSLFKQATMERFIGHFAKLLEEVGDNANRPVESLPLFESEERDQLVNTWNPTAEALPSESVITCLTRTASHNPSAIALRDGSGAIDYAELQDRAGSMATQLRDLGVTPGSVVAVLLPPSIDLGVSLVAILSAGASYLPLDARMPMTRLAQSLADGGVSFVLTCESQIDLLPSYELQFLPHAMIEDLSTTQPMTPFKPVKSSGDTPAYVMFTSGSTGQPKGVVIPHRAVVRLAYGMNAIKGDTPAVTLQAAPIAFDAATFEIWYPLLNGGQVCFPGVPISDAANLRANIARFGVNTMWLTAALFNTISDQDDQALADLSHLLIGGEALSPNHVNRALSTYPELNLINGYGPTENTTFTTCHLIAEPAQRAVPIGRPLTHSTTYIVDADLEPVPIGLPGELVSGGKGLAQGYLNSPGYTASRFVPDPFSEEPGARLFKIGDRARWLDSGHIDFLGRMDRQLKLRGFRIEPGEIESVLCEHPSIREAVILLREDLPGGRGLIGYVVPSNLEDSQNADNHTLCLKDHHELLDNLRTFLKDRLPVYMNPSFLIPLSSMPLNQNGKVDQNVLRKIDPIIETESFQAPRDEVERELAAIWEAVLGLDKVGREDRFFELGGHSLLATQVVSRVEQTFTVDMPLRVIFEHETLADQAQWLRQQGKKSASNRPSIERVSRQDNLPLSFAQKRLWLLDQLDPGNTAFNIVYSLRLGQDADLKALNEAFRAMLTRHEVLRTTIDFVDGEPYQAIGEIDSHPLEIADLQDHDPGAFQDAVQQLATDCLTTPFDLATGPLIRLIAARASDGDTILICAMHHIITDGWSNPIFVNEFTAYYQAALTGQNPSLPALSIQYADYAAWQQNWLRGETLAAEGRWWVDYLDGAPIVQKLPTINQRPMTPSNRMGVREIHIVDDLAKGVREECMENGVSPFIYLLAIYKILLHCHTGETDVVIGTDFANRGHHDIEPLIGFFVNELVLRTHLDAQAPFEENLAGIRKNVLDAFSHGEFPFDQLVETMKPERTPHLSPLFQRKFMLLSVEPNANQQSGTSSLDLVEPGLAKMDLQLTFIDDSQSLMGLLQYKADLFTEAAMRQFADEYQQLVRFLVEDRSRTAASFKQKLETERKARQQDSAAAMKKKASAFFSKPGQ